MATIIIPTEKMMVKKAIDDPRNKWTMLGSDKWKYDFGLKRTLLDHGFIRIADYLWSDKRHKTLWDLILTTDENVAEAICTWYGFEQPKYFKRFLSDVFNNVAADQNWKVKNAEQMNHFPYKELHEHFILNFKQN